MNSGVLGTVLDGELSPHVAALQSLVGQSERYCAETTFQRCGAREDEETISIDTLLNQDPKRYKVHSLSLIKNYTLLFSQCFIF